MRFSKYLAEEPFCPKCKAPGVHPDLEHMLVRAHKVQDDQGFWSQCLVCSGHYKVVWHKVEGSRKLEKEILFDTENHDPAKGWFCTPYPEGL